MNTLDNNRSARQRGRAVDLISGAISVALLSGFTWWFLELVADAGAVIV